MSQDNLNLIIKAIKKILDPKKIILFGSYSRGENTKDSDLDLAVLQKETPKVGEIANVLTYLYRSKYNWDVSPDIHLFSEKNCNQRLNNNSLFIREIVKGKTIYEIKIS